MGEVGNKTQADSFSYQLQYNFVQLIAFTNKCSFLYVGVYEALYHQNANTKTAVTRCKLLDEVLYSLYALLVFGRKL